MFEFLLPFFSVLWGSALTFLLLHQQKMLHLRRLRVIPGHRLAIPGIGEVSVISIVGSTVEVRRELFDSEGNVELDIQCIQLTDLHAAGAKVILINPRQRRIPLHQRVPPDEYRAIIDEPLAALIEAEFDGRLSTLVDNMTPKIEAKLKQIVDQNTTSITPLKLEAPNSEHVGSWTP